MSLKIPCFAQVRVWSKDGVESPEEEAMLALLLLVAVPPADRAKDVAARLVIARDAIREIHLAAAVARRCELRPGATDRGRTRPPHLRRGDRVAAARPRGAVAHDRERTARCARRRHQDGL